MLVDEVHALLLGLPAPWRAAFERHGLDLSDSGTPEETAKRLSRPLPIDWQTLDIAVLAYQYRPARRTGHRQHVGFVFSRLGIARNGDVDTSTAIDATGVNGWLRRAMRFDVATDSSLFWLRRGYARGPGTHGGTCWNITRAGWLWMRATSTFRIWTSQSTLRDGEIAWPADTTRVGPVWRDAVRCAAVDTA